MDIDYLLIWNYIIFFNVIFIIIYTDGKQIEPKLVRVIPVLKRISNALPKAPSPTHLKRIIGCSWSAFKGLYLEQTRLKDNHN